MDIDSLSRLALLPTNAPEPCVSLVLGALEPQPDYQRVAQQWGRGLLGGALLNPLEVLGPGVGHAIW